MRNDTIEVRVTEDERAAIRDAAERAGLSVSAWVRTVALRAAREGE